MARKDTEAEILRAATEVFLKKGFHGARTQEIADRAGINKALLHYYFKNKEQLFNRILEDGLRTILRDMRLTFETRGDMRTVLRTVIDRYLENLTRNSTLARFLVWELAHGGKNVTRILREEIITGGVETLPFFAIYQKALSKGEIREFPPVHLFLNVISMCIYPFVASPILEKVFPGIVVSDPEFIETRKRVIFDCVWRGIAGPNAPVGEEQ